MTNAAYGIYALDMLHAQAATIGPDVIAAAQAKADRVRELTGETGKVAVHIPVFDIYAPDARIGYLVTEL